ncbi:LacI family DNA-binding transcriptional regulator [Alteromonas stellipolaris]|uniref:LacI family DNA-binding transcriptional regulator n=1 Tax=Alteromonas stellipolaris TaxID=233316 RepID=UPI0026E3FC70|nr:LacI family DNA-binding transcriptional regulator [Alteromonas stellipolaris]MDO6539752.1 LacI family DNA-binding transcriptional regulator [Alteromonas stellipolaris]
MVAQTVTIKDIAKLANVSIATVSRVLNHNGKVKSSTKTKIQRVIDKMNFKPNAYARDLVRSRVSSLGVIYPHFSFDCHAFIGISQKNTAAPLPAFIAQTAHSELEEDVCIQNMNASYCSGIVLCQSRATTQTLNSWAKKLPHLFCIDRQLTSSPFQNVTFNHLEAGVLQATEALKNGGKYGIVIHSTKMDHASSQRFAGTIGRLSGSKHNIEFETFHIDLCNIDSSIELVMKHEAQFKRADFVIAENDFSAYGVVEALKALAVNIPHEVTVIGFGNHMISTISYPKLTTVQYPFHQMLHEVVHRIEKQTIQTNQFRPTLVKRQTS